MWYRVKFPTFLFYKKSWTKQGYCFFLFLVSFCNTIFLDVNFFKISYTQWTGPRTFNVSYNYKKRSLANIKYKNSRIRVNYLMACLKFYKLCVNLLSRKNVNVKIFTLFKCLLSDSNRQNLNFEFNASTISPNKPTSLPSYKKDKIKIIKTYKERIFFANSAPITLATCKNHR